MWSALPLADLLRRRFLGRSTPDLADAADRAWEIAPGEAVVAPPALFLPGQLERVTGWAFADEHPRRKMEGGHQVAHGPTRGFLLREAWLIDGVAYAGRGARHLLPLSSRVPRLTVDRTIDRGALYATFPGNRYFGQWLMDDCATYSLAEAEGTPITTSQPPFPHVPGYERALGMSPTRLGGAFFGELVVFDDVGQNRHKHRRCRAMGERLRAGREHVAHPGVFLLRGLGGERRALRNEVELAEHLRRRRGFRVIDASRAEVPDIVETCAGARAVVGLEGSGLMHGILHLPPGGAIVTLQPPSRFVGVYKDLADRDHQHFAFVVGIPDGDGFRIDVDEVERTLDLVPA